MTATTWVQIIKAVLLLAGASFMALMVMSQFGFSPEAMFAKAVEIKTLLAAQDAKVIADATAKGVDVAVVAAAKGESIMAPGSFVKDPISAISFGMALMFGTAGLPHILDAKGALKGGGNMAAIHLASAVGGNVFLGFISAVAFATILAVVAGLTLSGASAVSHDLYATVFKNGNADSASELRVSRITTLVLGLVAVVLGIAFEKQNIAFMVSLAFAIAPSAHFPVLFMPVLWKNCTTKGAVIGGFLGLISSVGLTVVSPSIWEAVMGNPKGSAWFPYTSPALFSMTIGFVGIWLFSILDNSEQAKKERADYADQETRSETGVGAASASAH